MWIAEVKEGKEEVVEFFGVVLRKKGENRYRVFDRSGEVWVESETPLGRGKAYAFKGKYRGGVVEVEEVKELTDRDDSLFLPYAQNTQLDEKRFWEIVDRIEDTNLKAFLHFIFEPIWEDFKKGVAAKRYHHAYVGGLLEHTANVAEMALKLSPLYEPLGLRKDLAIAGALLHDVGKVWELEVFPAFEYHKDFRKWGHIFIGASLVKEKGEEFGLPEDILTDLVHIILAHHGDFSKGSPVVPMIPEALFVHLIDNLDAQMNHVLKGGEEEF